MEMVEEEAKGRKKYLHLFIINFPIANFEISLLVRYFYEIVAEKRPY